MTVATDQTPSRVPELSVDDVRRLILSDAEHAVIDVRDLGRHARDGHILLSIPVPLGRLETEISDAVPLLTTRIVAYDGGDGDLAHRGADRLLELGYTNVAVLAGGTQAWQAAGGELFTGWYVLGIAFGEFVEHHYQTPWITASQLKDSLDAGENVVVVDCRPDAEFHRFSIPGALDLPGAELTYRIRAAVGNPTTRVVITCAGRTRAIIGAQSLINAGLENPVVSLAGGTMDWLFEGHSLVNGANTVLPEPQGAALEDAREVARRLSAHYAIAEIDARILASFRREHDEGQRSLYLLDVRTEAEFLAGHVPGSRWAQGGQLVQRVEHWAGIKNSRIVLVDDAHGVRAAHTAAWLKQINWAEVYVLKGGVSGPVETGAAPRRLAAPLPAVSWIAADVLAADLDNQRYQIIDLSSSVDYRRAHIPGARHVLRTQLCAADIGSGLPVVLVSEDGALAAFAAADLAARGLDVHVLRGGFAAWQAAGREVQRGAPDLPLHYDDVVINPYDEPAEKQLDAFRSYLAWEGAMVAQLGRDATTQFRLYSNVSQYES